MKYILTICLLVLIGCGSYHTTTEGKAGRDGVDGAVGPRGEKGDRGEQGVAGTSCTVSTVSPNVTAPNGGSLITCPDGTQSLILNGTNGIDGQDGRSTVVRPVKLCPGASSYPSTFIEYAFCIDNKLFGVYSDHGGFLTEILPGRWESDAINSRCTFEVLQNCVIRN